MAVAAFLTPLDVRILDAQERGRLVYQLLVPFRYESALLVRVVTVPAGFVTDLESVPRSVSVFAGPPCPKAGVVHDWLYAAHETDKSDADRVYYEALLVAGLDPVWADQRYASVDYYGASAWESGPSRLRVVA